MPHFSKPYLRKGRGLWYVQIDGRQINLGPDRDEAFDRYHRLMADRRTERVETLSVAAVIDRFLDWTQKNRAPDTYEWYRYRLERFARSQPDLRAGDLRKFHVQEWLDELGGLSSGSKRNHCRAVKRCFRWAENEGYVEKNHIAGLEQPKAGKREQVVTLQEFERLVALTRDRTFEDLLVVTWETGCRPQESLRVEARHVDLSNQRWVFPQSEAKGGVLRIVYLTDKALAITRRLMLRYPEGKLITSTPFA